MLERWFRRQLKWRHEADCRVISEVGAGAEISSAGGGLSPNGVRTQSMLRTRFGFFLAEVIMWLLRMQWRERQLIASPIWTSRLSFVLLRHSATTKAIERRHKN